MASNANTVLVIATDQLVCVLNPMPLADTSCPARVPQRKTVQVMSDKNINGKVITAGAS